MKISLSYLALFLIVILTACQPASAPEAIAQPTAETVQADPLPPEPSPSPLPEHRIGIRVVDGPGEFYDRETGEIFVPRGANYVFVPHNGTMDNLLLREGVYDPLRTRSDFNRLASLGYNTVRVFLDQCSMGLGCITEQGRTGLNENYLSNIADMSLAAREAGVYILFTSNDLPDGGGYADEANRDSGELFAGYRNSYYLRPEAISATRRYWRDLLNGLQEQEAAFDAILAWQLLNEQWMFKDQPPLSLSSGLVETTTGFYDMSDQAQKELMVSDGIKHYIAQMKEEILIHDPTALVTMGFFVPELVAPGWYVETASLLQDSGLDFFDFHAYSGPISLEEHAQGFGMVDYSEKPIILGEYGPFRHTYTRLDSAARATSAWVAESCRLGFDGWLYWTYYPAAANISDRTWGLVDEEEYLLELFAPVNQPDPCVAVEIPHENLAYGKPVSASLSLAEEPPQQAIDDNPASQWGAGADAVQWIEVDLENTFSITEIRLLVAQWPEGQTLHRVQVRASEGESYITVHEFNESTQDNDWLIHIPDQPLENVRFIRIQTVSSPSWVAWKEIEVIGDSP